MSAQCFFVVRISGSLTVVDVFNGKRLVHPWRMYYPVSSATLNRLRAVWRSNKKKVHVMKGEFSRERRDALREMEARRQGKGFTCLSANK